MGSYVTNVLKKKAKQLHDGYVKLKVDKKKKKERKKEDCDESGSYKAEPSEELYERLSFVPERRIQNYDSGCTSRKTSKLSLPIPCSSKNSSNDSQDKLLDSPCSSLDSGISRSPTSFKKLKKLQFSADSDVIHFFERDALEGRSCSNDPCLNEKHMEAELYKTKVYEVPTAEKVKIINKSYSPDANSPWSVSEVTPEIPFGQLRIKQSIVSPKTYKRTPKKKSVSQNSFLGNFAQRLPQITPPQKISNLNEQNQDNAELSVKRDSTRKSLKNCNDTCDSNILTPSLKSPPEKPPRLVKDLKKISLDLAPTDPSQNKYTETNDTEWTFLSCDAANSTIDEVVYSIPFDIKKDQPETFSTPLRKLSLSDKEPVYAQVTPRSSRDADKMISSTPVGVTGTSSGQIYGHVTSCHSENLQQDISSPKLNPFHKPTNSKHLQNSENYFTSSGVSPISDVKNDILSNECKDKLNLIHKTNWSLQKGDVAQEHECLHKNKTPEEVYVEEKFVVNMFQSRPSKRWEKHVRDMDRHKDNQNSKFDRNIWNRQSLDSKKQAMQCLEANLQSMESNFDNVEKEIGKLEKESTNLEMVSKKIKNELKRMEQEDNEAFAKKLEKERLRIEDQMNKLNNNVDGTSKKLTDETKRIEVELEQIQSQNTEDYKQYKKLKKSRDIECSRMTQASRALEEIKNRRGKKDWLEILVAERTLLETSEKVRVLTQQIRDNTYTTIPEPPLHKGTIHLSDIRFPFAKQFRGNSKREKYYTDFFVMTLSNGTQIFVSEFITGESDPLRFSRNHTFKNLKPDFEIKIKLFHVRLRTSDEYFWEKFKYYNLCPTSQIIYEDLLTHQFQEKTVYKTSFKLCAETSLTRTNINDISARLTTKPQVFGKLDTQMEFNLKCEDIDIVARLSGFLDVGTLCGETYFWEKKWCVLNGANLMLYNYPQEEDFGKPFEQINLEYCFGPIVTKVDNCPKRRSFHLKTGRPNDLLNSNRGEPQVHTLKTKPNFTLRKFYFAAGNMEDYHRWTVEVEKILNSLSDFKKLAFGEEYAEYLRH